MRLTNMGSLTINDAISILSKGIKPESTNEQRQTLLNFVLERLDSAEQSKARELYMKITQGF